MPESDPEPASRPLFGRSPGDRFPSRGPVRVLVVIPDAELRTQAEAALAGQTQVIVVPDASLALASAFPASADVILADVAVGEDMMRVLRADRRTRGVPILVLTTRTEPGGVIQGLAGDADGYLLKPVPPLEVAARGQAHAQSALVREEALRLEEAGRSE